MTRRFVFACSALLSTAVSCAAQAVAVTLQLDSTSIAAGETTQLHVLAQIVPSQRASSDRIFSWYIDLLDNDGSVAIPQFDQLRKTASDQDSQTSSSGRTDGAHRRGIYDTFLNLPNAGRDTPVELFSVPVSALAPGRVVFSVQAGTTVSELNSDFIVAPAGGGDPRLGGDYSGAKVELQVRGTAAPRLSISSRVLASQEQVLTVTFTPQAGQTHVVEYRNDLGSGPAWQSLPGAPHNSGTVTDTNRVVHRFYRLRVTN